MLNFRIGSVSSIGGLIAVTLFAATVSDSQNLNIFKISFRDSNFQARMDPSIQATAKDPKVEGSRSFGDKFGESLGGSQAPPSFWKVAGLPRKFPELPQKFSATSLEFSHCGTE